MAAPVPSGQRLSTGPLAPGQPGQPRLLRLHNDRSALDLLLELGPLSRVQICELTGLSKPTASRLLARLEETGLVRAAGTSSGGPGRNAVLYAVNGEAAYVAAIDVRPRRFTVRIADLAGTVWSEEVVAIGSGQDRTPAKSVLRALEKGSEACGIDVARIDSVTLSVPGAYDAVEDRIALVEELPGWDAAGALASVRAELGATRVLIENDVNLAAVAERSRGVARDVESFAVLWVAAGLGLAIDLGGRLHRGATGGAGEVGYMQVTGDARRLTDLVGGSSVRILARDHGISARTAAAAVAKAVHDPGHEPFLDELAQRLAAGLAVIISVLDPHLVVLSGDISTAGGPVLADRVEKALGQISTLRPSVKVSGVEGNSALVGAMELSLQHTRDALFQASTDNVQ
jgi:predicted NBD/HSP70 family sugar kinase